jgi:2-oxoisovalerate dehydrogenase E1 component
VATATLLVHAGLMTPDELLARYDEVGWEVRRVAEEVLAEPKLTGRPRSSRRSRRAARPGGPGGRRGRRLRARGRQSGGRAEAFGGRRAEKAGR